MTTSSDAAHTDLSLILCVSVALIEPVGQEQDGVGRLLFRHLGESLRQKSSQMFLQIFRVHLCSAQLTVVRSLQSTTALQGQTWRVALNQSFRDYGRGKIKHLL